MTSRSRAQRSSHLHRIGNERNVWLDFPAIHNHRGFWFALDARLAP